MVSEQWMAFFMYSSLSSSESLLLNQFRGLKLQLDQQMITFEEIVDVLNRAKNTEILLKLAEIYKPLESWCASDEMNDYWNERWALYGRYPTWPEAQTDSSVTYRALIAQPRISSFNLVRGMWIFNKVNCLAPDHPNHPDVKPLYLKAMTYHNFEAIQSYSLLQLEDFKKGDHDDPDKVIENVLVSANYHGTPIYLLAALRCVEIGFYYYKESSEDPLAQSYFLRALIYLETAELLFGQFSEAIHNAYYGQGIMASNPYRLQDFNTMRSRIESYLDSGILSWAKNFINAKSQANAENFTSDNNIAVGLRNS